MTSTGTNSSQPILRARRRNRTPSCAGSMTGCSASPGRGSPRRLACSTLAAVQRRDCAISSRGASSRSAATSQRRRWRRRGGRCPRCDLVAATWIAVCHLLRGASTSLLLGEVVEHSPTSRRCWPRSGACSSRAGVCADHPEACGTCAGPRRRLGGPTWTGDTDPDHINLQSPRTLRPWPGTGGFSAGAPPHRLEAGRARRGSSPAAAAGCPYPPDVGNGIMACGRA